MNYKNQTLNTKNDTRLLGLFKPLLLILATVTLVTACNNKANNEDGTSGNVAGTPLDNGCADPRFCDPSVYTNNNWPVYQQNNIYANDASFCGCPSGNRPVYNPNWGMGCSPIFSAQTLSNNHQYFALTFQANSGWGPYSYQTQYVTNSTIAGYPGSNHQQLNTPVLIYQPMTEINGYACYNNILTVCDTRNGNSCGSSGYCQPSGVASAIGYCTYDPISHQNPGYPFAYPSYYPRY
jgi:hypothetical protein